MRLKLGVLTIALAVSSYADLSVPPADSGQIKENILAGQAGQKTSPVTPSRMELNLDANTSIPKKQSKKKSSYSYADEKILNFILASQDASKSGDLHRDDSMQNQQSMDIKLVRDRNRTKATDTALASTQPTNKKAKMLLASYCTVANDTEVITKGVLTAYCQNQNGNFEVGGELKSDNQSYALYATPQYVKFANGKRYEVEQNKSVILNGNKTSYNVASFINTHKIDKLLREGIQSTAKDVASTAKEYMNDLKASRTQQEVVSVPNAGTTVATNTQKPVVSDYVSILGIQISANLIDKWAAIAYEDHPWSYKTIKGSKIYVELLVKERDTE